MPEALIAGFLDAVGVMPSAFDSAGIGTVPAPRIEVPGPGDVGHDALPGGPDLVRGKSRAGGPARDPHGALEPDPVRVDPGCCRGGADQGADRVVGQQVAPELLLDQLRAPGAQDLSRAAQVRFQLGVAALVLVRSARSAVLALRPARFSGPRSRTGRAAWHRIRLSAGPRHPWAAAACGHGEGMTVPR